MEIRALTGLRGFAALWVFFLHAMWGETGGYFGKLASFGGAGVIIFFVLSGFILSLTYDGREYTYSQFVRARLARVYPLHLVTLLATLGLSYLGYVSILPSDDAYTFILNLLLVQSWGFTPLVSWNQPAWSISHEFFAYLLFPVFIGALMRANKKTALVIAALLLVCCAWAISAPFRLAIWMEWIAAPKQFEYGSSLLWFFAVFCVGCVAYRLSKTVHMPTLAGDAMAFSGLAIFAASPLYADLAVPPILAIIGSTLLVVGLRQDAGLGRLVFGNGVSWFLGRISFALYLSAPMVEFTLKHFVYPLPLWVNLTACLCVASILHSLIEKPAQRFIRGL